MENTNMNKVSYELVATSDELVSGYLNPFNKVNKLKINYSKINNSNYSK